MILVFPADKPGGVEFKHELTSLTEARASILNIHGRN